MAFGLSCPADLVPPSHSWVLSPNPPPLFTHRLIMSRNSILEFSLILNLVRFVSTQPPRLESSLSLFIFDDGRRGEITFSWRRPLRDCSPEPALRELSLFRLSANRYAGCPMQPRSLCVIPGKHTSTVGSPTFLTWQSRYPLKSHLSQRLPFQSFASVGERNS